MPVHANLRLHASLLIEDFVSEIENSFLFLDDASAEALHWILGDSSLAELVQGLYPLPAYATRICAEKLHQR
jgi:hypothetical protein